MKAAALFIALAGTLFAGEPPENLRTASPDARFRVSVVEVADTHTRRLEIRTAGGELLYSSPPQIDGTDVLEFYPDHLRWSADSKVLAIAGGFPKFIQTYLFAWDGARFERITVPALASGYDNPWIVPAEWKPGHRLTLKISGPYAGKANGYHYTGTATLAIDLSSKTATKIAERIK